MAKIRLEGFMCIGNGKISKDEINCSHEPSGICGTISAHYISKEKIKELVYNGFAYTYQPIERIT